MKHVLGIALTTSVLIASCGGHQRVPYAVVSGPRDWATFPAIVEMNDVPTLYAASDVHGGYDRILALLTQHHLVALDSSTPSGAHWIGGNSVLVVTGDLVDKGPSSIEVVDLFRALEGSAAAAGGRVIVSLGNHEAEFLDDPNNDKATSNDGFETELRAHGLDAVASANGSEGRGQWLRQRPFGARVGRWFFAHAGDTHGRSVAEPERLFQAAVAANDYHDNAIIGADSLLESRDWYENDPSLGERYATAVGARHIVFGHQPAALGARGAIAVGQAGALFRIDCGLSPDVNDSAGELLRVRTDAGLDIAEALSSDGSIRELWRGPIE